MKIAFVSTMGGAPWGGSEELWWSAACRAREAGHDVLVSAYDHGVVPARLEEIRGQGARMHFRRRGVHRRIDEALAFLRPRFRPLARFGPDVVCVSQGASYDLVTQGDCTELRLWLESSITPFVLVCQLNHDSGPLSGSRRELAGRTFSRASRIAFVARRNLLEAQRHLARPLPNAVVVRNPVNLSSLEAVPWPRLAPTARWASVARLETAYKGQDALLEALSTPNWKDRDWRLTLCGKGPDERYLRDLTAYYGLAERVVFAQHVTDVRAIWAEHEMLLLPSREEGTPLGMVEAMACGRPCLVTDVAGNTEWVREDESGFVAASARTGALRDALERAWARRDRWKQLGEAARRTAIVQMDPDPGATLLRLLVDAVGSGDLRRE